MGKSHGAFILWELSSFTCSAFVHGTCPMGLFFLHFGGLVNPFPNKPWFLCVCSTSPLKTLTSPLKTLWEKEKLLITSNFSFSHSVFYPFGELSAIFIKFEIVVFKNFVWKSLKFVVWERVNEYRL